MHKTINKEGKLRKWQMTNNKQKLEICNTGQIESHIIYAILLTSINKLTEYGKTTCIWHEWISNTSINLKLSVNATQKTNRRAKAILRINHLLNCWIFHHFLQSFHWQRRTCFFCQQMDKSLTLALHVKVHRTPEITIGKTWFQGDKKVHMLQLKIQHIQMLTQHSWYHDSKEPQGHQHSPNTVD